LVRSKISNGCLNEDGVQSNGDCICKCVI